jgi:hypothetical protein
MRIIRTSVWALLLLCLILPVWAAPAVERAEGETGIHKYLPGDVVHLVINAPLDTARVTAIAPDGKTIEMAYDKEAKAWDGYWEIPLGFKKGVYSATLKALDVENRKFEGKTAAFYVGEPVLPLVLKLEDTERAEVAAPPAARKAEVKKPEPAKEIAAEEEKGEEEKPAAMVTPVKRAIAARPRPKENINVTRLRLMSAARKFLAENDYKRAEGQLRALLKIDPDNSDIKQMLGRIEAVIKAKEKIE